MGEIQCHQIADVLGGNTHLVRDVVKQFQVLLGYTAVEQNHRSEGIDEDGDEFDPGVIALDSVQREDRASVVEQCLPPMSRGNRFSPSTSPTTATPTTGTTAQANLSGLPGTPRRVATTIVAPKMITTMPNASSRGARKPTPPRAPNGRKLPCWRSTGATPPG